MPVEIAAPIPFESDDESRVLRRRRGAAVLAGARPDRPGVRGVPSPIRRQGQPGAPVLGRARPGRDPLLGPRRAAPPGRRTELRTPRDAGGVLARGEQRRLLAGTRRRRRLLLLRLPGTRRLPVDAGRTRRRPASTTRWASSCCPTRWCAPRPIPTPCSSSSSRAPTKPPRARRQLGPSEPRTHILTRPEGWSTMLE